MAKQKQEQKVRKLSDAPRPARTPESVLQEILEKKGKAQDQLTQKLAEELTEKEVAQLVVECARLDGERRWIESQVSPLKNVIKGHMEAEGLEFIETDEVTAVLSPSRSYQVSALAVAEALIKKTKDKRRLRELFDAYFNVALTKVKKQEGQQFLDSCGGTETEGTPRLSFK